MTVAGRLGLGLALPLLASLAACTPRSPSVARMESHPAHLRLAYPEFAEVEIVLEPLLPLPEGAGTPIVFLHLNDEPGSVARTFDHTLAAPWKPGRTIRHVVRVYQSALAEPLEPGLYSLTVGLYDRYLGRYRLATSDAEVARGEYKVGDVEVPAPEAEIPHLRFSENWLPAEAGADRQILVRRALGAGGPGRLQVGPLQGPGRLYLAFEIPFGAAGTRLDLAAGETEPRLGIVSDCGGERIELAGGGRHDVDLFVPPAAIPWHCDLEIAPNFRLQSRERAEASSARLQIVAWSAGAEPGPR